MSDYLNDFSESVLKYRWWVIALTVVYAFITFEGLGGLVKRSDYKAFMDPEYPGMVELDEIESIFTENKNAFLVIAPDDEQVFTVNTLKAIQEITAQAWLIPYASRVSSVTNYQYTHVDGDDLHVSFLVPDEEVIDDVMIERAKKVTLAENSLRGLLVSEKQHVAAININFQFQDGELLSREQVEVSNGINSLVADFAQRYPNIKIMVAGSVVIDYVADEYSARTNKVQMPWMLGIMGLLLIVLLRSFWGTLGIAVIVILTGLTTMGVFGWFKLEVDGVTAISPIVIMTLAVADSIHIIAGMLNGMRMGMPKREAIIHSLKQNFMPVFLTSLTTVLGVITFSFSDFPSLRKLGLIIALGVIVAFILSVTLLPVLLSLFPIRQPKQLKESKRTFWSYDAYGDWVIKHHRRILPISVLVCLGCSLMLSKIVINESFEHLFKNSTPEQQAINFITDNLSGFQSMDVAIFNDQVGGISHPEFLETVESFSHWLREQEGVTHVTSVTDTFKRLNQTMHNNDSAWYKLPENKELAAQYLLLYEMSLPYGLDLNNQINLDKSGTLLNLMMAHLTSGEVVALDKKILAWFEHEAPHLRAVPTGMLPLMSEMGYVHMIPKMMKGGLIAIFMVSLVLLFALRSWRLGFLGMLANIVPIMIGFGLWGATFGMVNFAVASVAGICLGVVVDFAVHFLNKYQQGCRQGTSAEDGVRYAFNKVAAPLTITMVVLVSGFWVLASTPFNLVGQLGLLTGVVILLALVFDLLVLPAILLTFGKKFYTV